MTRSAVAVVVRLCSLIAPPSRRGTFHAQWSADLEHYQRWLSTNEPSAIRRAARMAGRSSGCLPHAVLLRLAEWSLTTMTEDFRFAWRMLIRRPGFTAAAVLMLALAMGANTTVFAWLQSVLLQPVRGVDASALIALHGKSPTRDDLSFSYPNFLDLRAARADGVEDVIAFRGVAMSLTGKDGAQRIWGQLVTPNFFELLRVRPALGRGFLESEGSTPEREQVAVLSHHAWQRLFAGDSAIIGRTITLNARPFTVIGVAPPGFRGTMTGLALDVFVPLTMQRAFLSGDRLPQRGNSFLQVYARLAPGATIERAQASLHVVAARLARDHPSNRGREITSRPLWRDAAAGLLLPVMSTLMAVVVVVLLIACANLAGLLLARAGDRQREIAVRLAVGASRQRLIRQLLLESLLLAAAGAIAGTVLTVWTSGALVALMPRTPFPVAFDAGVNLPVLAFAFATCVLTALTFGLVPALRASRPDVSTTLKQSGATIARGPRGRMRSTLVVAQLALSLLLLVCAALFVRDLTSARRLDPGFTIRDGVLAALDLLPNGYDASRGAAFHRELIARAASLPGVQSATLATAMPLDISAGSNMLVEIDGYTPAQGEEVDVYYNRVGPRYFETMGIAIVAGRPIDDRDAAGRQLAVVVNETMARRYWPGQDPVGRIVRFGNGPATVVGVARDGKYGRLGEAPRNYMYVPLAQLFRHDAVLIVRTAAAPDALAETLQHTVKQMDADLPLFDVRTVAEHRRLSVFIPRLAGILLTLFGALALLLAVVGLYGTMAYHVSQRRREIAVRLAVGASRRQILGLVLRHGLVLTGAGVSIGAALALAAAFALRSQFVGVSPADALSFGGTAIVLCTASVAACLIPALRATGLDPIRTLRLE